MQMQKLSNTNTKTFKHKYKYKKKCQACQPPQPGWLLATLSLSSRPCPPDFPPTWVPLCRWQIQIQIWYQSIIMSKIKDTKKRNDNTKCCSTWLSPPSRLFLLSRFHRWTIGQDRTRWGGSRMIKMTIIMMKILINMITMNYNENDILTTQYISCIHPDFMGEK